VLITLSAHKNTLFYKNVQKNSIYSQKIKRNAIFFTEKPDFRHLLIKPNQYPVEYTGDSLGRRKVWQRIE